MKRYFLPAFSAMLAVAIVFGATAAANPGADAQATASKKGKHCKKGKGKGKHHRAALTSKKKGKSCKKPKPSGSTGNPGSGAQSPAPAPAPTIPGPPSVKWPPADGNYADSTNGIDVALHSGATTANLVFEGGKGTCVPAILVVKDAPTTVTADSLSASGEVQVPVEELKMKISIVIGTDLSYTATIDSSTESCSKPGVVFKGTLKSVA